MPPGADQRQAAAGARAAPPPPGWQLSSCCAGCWQQRCRQPELAAAQADLLSAIYFILLAAVYKPLQITPIQAVICWLSAAAAVSVVSRRHGFSVSAAAQRCWLTSRVLFIFFSCHIYGPSSSRAVFTLAISGCCRSRLLLFFLFRFQLFIVVRPGLVRSSGRRLTPSRRRPSGLLLSSGCHQTFAACPVRPLALLLPPTRPLLPAASCCCCCSPGAAVQATGRRPSRPGQPAPATAQPSDQRCPPSQARRCPAREPSSAAVAACWLLPSALPLAVRLLTLCRQTFAPGRLRRRQASRPCRRQACQHLGVRPGARSSGQVANRPGARLRCASASRQRPSRAVPVPSSGFVSFRRAAVLLFAAFCFCLFRVRRRQPSSAVQADQARRRPAAAPSVRCFAVSSFAALCSRSSGRPPSSGQSSFCQPSRAPEPARQPPPGRTSRHVVVRPGPLSGACPLARLR